MSTTPHKRVNGVVNGPNHVGSASTRLCFCVIQDVPELAHQSRYFAGESSDETDTATEIEGDEISVGHVVRVPILAQHKRALHDAIGLELKSYAESTNAGINLIQVLEAPNNNDGPNIDVPRTIVRGEYTLYSPEFSIMHHQRYPSLWTEQFMRTWSADTLRLGYRWGQGGTIGLELTISGVERQFIGYPDLEG